MTRQIIQWTIPSLLHQSRRKNPFVHNGLTRRNFKLHTHKKIRIPGRLFTYTGSCANCLAIKYVKVNIESSFEKFGRAHIPNATYQDPRSLVFWLWRRLKGFYHIWAWQPSWSCVQHLNKLLFAYPKESPYEF